MSSYITVCLTAGYEENTVPGSGGALNTHQTLILMQPKQEWIFLKYISKLIKPHESINFKPTHLRHDRLHNTTGFMQLKIICL